MGLEQSQANKQIDKFINTLKGADQSLEERVAQLEAHEGSPAFSLSVAILADQKAAGTNGGGLTGATWNTRTLNTEVSDVDGIVTLSANQFTLQPGTYIIRASATAFDVNFHKIRLRNITAGNTSAAGTSEQTSAADTTATRSFLVYYAVIVSATVYEIQHWVESTNATDGGGIVTEAGNAEVETFALVEITKIA